MNVREFIAGFIPKTRREWIKAIYNFGMYLVFIGLIYAALNAWHEGYSVGLYQCTLKIVNGTLRIPDF